MANDLEVTIGVRNAPFKNGLEEVQQMAKSFRSELTSQFAAALTFGGIAGAISHVVEYAKHIRDLSNQYAVSTTVLQQWGAAAAKGGMDIEALAGSFNDLEIAKSEALGGDDEMQKQFQALGVTLKDLEAMSPDQIMMKIARGSMDAAAMVRVMGEDAVKLRPILKDLASGASELGSAMSEQTIATLAQLAESTQEVMQDLRAIGGTLVAYLVQAGQGLGVIFSVVFEGVTAALPALGEAIQRAFKLDLTGAKAAGEEAVQAFLSGAEKAAAAGVKTLEQYRAKEQEHGETKAKLSQAALAAIDKEINLQERLDEIRRQAAMEEASDQEKLEQLLDREIELRLKASQLKEDSAEGMEAMIAAEEAALEVLRLRNQMAEKEKAQREKEAQERKAEREKMDRDVESANTRLREERDRLTVMQAQNTQGDAMARRLEQQLEYQKKIADLEDRIAKAKKENNLELADALTKTQQLIQQQQQLDDDGAQRTLDAFGGHAPTATELRRQGRERERQERTQARDKERLRKNGGVIPTRRDINGNVTYGLDADPASKTFGQEIPVRPDGKMGGGDVPPPMAQPGDTIPAAPKPGKDAPAQDPIPAKLDEVITILGEIKEVATPALHIGG